MVDTPETLTVRKSKDQQQKTVVDADNSSSGNSSDDDGSDADDSDADGPQEVDSLTSFKNESGPSGPSYSIDGLCTPSPSTARPSPSSSLGSQSYKRSHFLPRVASPSTCSQLRSPPSPSPAKRAVS